MISPKKLIKMARKWQKWAAVRRRRISSLKQDWVVDGNNCSTSSIADKGHFVVYSVDQSRFVIPLVYLNNDIFRELFRMSEKEFGLPSDGPITLPCDAVFFKYVISLIQRHAAKDLEKALLMSMATGCCLSTLYPHQEQTNQNLLICSF
ncbi:hypothetical protein L1049_007795 [Liquidambar formosana]|uniref:Small auxin up regulated protein n=1 Tax=Liquidambar formosana TaxID=63359 RepID=A0AAP0S8D7_LIQFO